MGVVSLFFDPAAVYRLVEWKSRLLSALASRSQAQGPLPWYRTASGCFLKTMGPFMEALVIKTTQHLVVYKENPCFWKFRCS